MKNNAPTTLIHQLVHRSKETPKKTAWVHLNGQTLIRWTWADLAKRLANYASALKNLGIKSKDRVILYAPNSLEWALMDLALLTIGAISIPIYSSVHENELDEILTDCKPQWGFLDGELRAHKLLKTKHSPNFKQIITLSEVQKEGSFSSLDSLLEQSTLFSLETLHDSVDPSATATIIYTSGTSGTPKGVPITHSQIMHVVGEVFEQLEVTAKDRSLTVLPFAHVLGRIELWGNPAIGYTLGLGQSMEKLKEDFPIINPTIFVGVPRIFEKIFYGLQSQLQVSPLKRFFYSKAMDASIQLKQTLNKKKDPSWLNIIKFQVADKILFKEFRRRMGGNLRFFVSGGAPLDPHLAEFFASWGLPIYQGYGLTETTGPIFVNSSKSHRKGSVGKALPSVDCRIEKDGEILVRSPQIFSSYYKNKKLSDRLFTKDGFLKTGDIGEIDKDGYLFITDRKKELIKTSGGKFVSPQKIQNLFAKDPYVSQVYVHGDKEKYIVALITINPDQLKANSEDSKTDGSMASQVNMEALRLKIKESVARVNRQLARFEKIKKYEILTEEFSIKNGEITPSLKLKRKIIAKIHQRTITSLYKG